MDELVHGWVDRWLDNECMSGWMDKWKDGQMGEWMDGWIGWKDSWISVRMN